MLLFDGTKRSLVEMRNQDDRSAGLLESLLEADAAARYRYQDLAKAACQLLTGRAAGGRPEVT